MSASERQWANPDTTGLHRCRSAHRQPALQPGACLAILNVSSTDVNIYAIAITIVVFVAALAALIPARRAASVDPMRALRTE
jgi:hypothetical protein